MGTGRATTVPDPVSRSFGCGPPPKSRVIYNFAIQTRTKRNKRQSQSQSHTAADGEPATPQHRRDTNWVGPTLIPHPRGGFSYRAAHARRLRGHWFVDDVWRNCLWGGANVPLQNDSPCPPLRNVPAPPPHGQPVPVTAPSTSLPIPASGSADLKSFTFTTNVGMSSVHLAIPSSLARPIQHPCPRGLAGR